MPLVHHFNDSLKLRNPEEPDIRHREIRSSLEMAEAAVPREGLDEAELFGFAFE